MPAAVFEQSERVGAGAPVVAVAGDAAALNPAQRPPVDESGGPDCALAILEEPAEVASSQRVVLHQPTVLPADQTLVGTDPEGAVAAGDQAGDRVRWKRAIDWPGNGLYSV